MYYKFLKDFVNKKEGEVYKLHPTLGANLVARKIAVKVDEAGEEIEAVKVEPVLQPKLEQVMVPELDKDGKPILNKDGKPIMEPKLDKDGNYIMQPKLDKDGKPIMEAVKKK